MRGKILEIRLPKNLAKVDLVICDLHVISNFKAGLSNQAQKHCASFRAVSQLYLNVNFSSNQSDRGLVVRTKDLITSCGDIHSKFLTFTYLKPQYQKLNSPFSSPYIFHRSGGELLKRQENLT